MSELEMDCKFMQGQLEIIKSLLERRKEEYDFDTYELEGHIDEMMNILDAILDRVEEEAREEDE